MQGQAAPRVREGGAGAVPRMQSLAPTCGATSGGGGLKRPRPQASQQSAAASFFDQNIGGVT